MDRYTQTFTVRWGDCDMNGHVRNTMYSEYAIETRMAYLTEHGFGYEQLAEHMIGPVLLREEIDYLREIRAGETVTVDFVQLGLSPEGGEVEVPPRPLQAERQAGRARRRPRRLDGSPHPPPHPRARAARRGAAEPPEGSGVRGPPRARVLAEGLLELAARPTRVPRTTRAAYL